MRARAAAGERPGGDRAPARRLGRAQQRHPCGRGRRHGPARAARRRRARGAGLVQLLTQPGLQFQVIVPGTRIMQEAYADAQTRPRAAELGVRGEIDQWRGGHRRDPG